MRSSPEPTYSPPETGTDPYVIPDRRHWRTCKRLCYCVRVLDIHQRHGVLLLEGKPFRKLADKWQSEVFPSPDLHKQQEPTAEVEDEEGRCSYV